MAPQPCSNIHHSICTSAPAAGHSRKGRECCNLCCLDGTGLPRLLNYQLAWLPGCVTAWLPSWPHGPGGAPCRAAVEPAGTLRPAASSAYLQNRKPAMLA